MRLMARDLHIDEWEITALPRDLRLNYNSRRRVTAFQMARRKVEF
jgi:hypothetical protein